MERLNGLSFKKMDLHVHTPVSHDFNDKNITEDNIIEEALKKGLSAIAITDHNTGDFINKIKEKAQKKNLIVFPGVEITCSGGESGIHVLAIFDIDKDTAHINHLLSKLDITPDKKGKTDTITSKSVYDTIEIIGENNGIAILAHCGSTKGCLHDTKGQQRTRIFESKYLLGVEVSENDFMKGSGKRTSDYLNGYDSNYNNRKLGIYVASDSHCLSDIGSKFTYFKTDDSISLESLRQCFIDPDVRIIQATDYKENKYPFIKSVNINSGFFSGETALFHSGLNTIIGAKGSGKSLLIEFLRFALKQLPTDKNILQDHHGKIEKCLKFQGTIEVIVFDGREEKKIVRKFDKTESNNQTDSNDFPVLFLSQNEIIKIAENETEQMQFIDRFLDFKKDSTSIETIKRELRTLDSAFYQSIEATRNKHSLDNEISELNKKLEDINKQLQDERHNKYIKLETIESSIQTQIKDSSRLIQHIENIISQTNEFQITNFDENVNKEPIIQRNKETLELFIKNTKDVLINIKINSEEVKDKINVEYKSFLPLFSEEQKKYQEFIKGDGDKSDLENKRLEIFSKFKEKQSQLSLNKSKADSINSISENRNKKLDELEKLYKDLTVRRKMKCEFFEKSSKNRLKINIKETSDVSNFKDNLLSIKKGSYFSKDEIESICNNITPRDFIYRLLRYYTYSRNTNMQQKVIKEDKEYFEKENINYERIIELFNFFIHERDLLDLMKLQYNVIPEDVPEICIKIDDNYKPISEVSIGQKCTAMLIMVLSDGKIPVVVDQPEDSLDMRSIWSDMCCNIRDNKLKRQFIFTTHNSSLAVASDTDKFIIVESNANNGKIKMTGAIDTPKIKDKVIDYLEGSKDTYFNKYDKYNLEKVKTKKDNN